MRFLCNHVVRRDQYVQALSAVRQVPRRFVGHVRAGEAALRAANGINQPVGDSPYHDRLKEALNPSRAVHLPAGHATVVLHRARVTEEIVRFLGIDGTAPGSPS